MANGRVCTGFSAPYVGVYALSEAGAITYTSVQRLARGVDVTISPTASSDNKFYADNKAAESAGGEFTGGTFKITVDGLKPAAEKLIMGLPAAGTDNWTEYDNTAEVPYVGIGFVARYMEGGVDKFVPIIIVKCMFDPIENVAATSEDSIKFQTQSLSGSIFRADNTKETWKAIGQDCNTEADAITALTSKFAAM